MCSVVKTSINHPEVYHKWAVQNHLNTSQNNGDPTIASSIKNCGSRCQSIAGTLLQSNIESWQFVAISVTFKRIIGTLCQVLRWSAMEESPLAELKLMLIFAVQSWWKFGDSIFLLWFYVKKVTVFAVWILIFYRFNIVQIYISRCTYMAGWLVGWLWCSKL